MKISESSCKYDSYFSYFGAETSSVIPQIFSDGSYEFTVDGAVHKISFSEFGEIRSDYSWQLADGYLPFHIISYKTDNYSVMLTTFADDIASAERGIVAYTRVTLKNITSRTISLPPLADNASLLSPVPQTIAAGETATVDLAVKLEGSVADFGSFDEHYKAAKTKWESKLDKLLKITSPKINASNACRATYILAKLTQSGISTPDELARYCQLFLAIGDLSSARECLSAYYRDDSTITDADILLPWVASTYQIRSDDQAFLETLKPILKKCVSCIANSVSEETGIVNGNENFSSVQQTLTALLALESYTSIMGKLGEANEVISTRKLSMTIAKALKTSYEAEISEQASTLSSPFGSLLANGNNYVFSSADRFVDLRDIATAQYKSADAPQITTPAEIANLGICLNAKDAELREFPVYTFCKITAKTNVAPLVKNPSISDWCAACKVYIDSIISMRDSEMLLLGHALPSEWLENGSTVKIENYLTPTGKMIALTITKNGNTVTIDVSGDSLTAPIITSLPAMIGRNYTAEHCECYPQDVRVISMNNIRHVEIKID